MLTELKDWFAKRSPNHARHTRFSFDGHTFAADGPFARRISVRIEDVQEIGIETTDRGPFIEDLFWLINRDTDDLRIPQDSPVFATLMDYFGKWEGFDWQPFTEAMACAECRYFLCWKRSDKSDVLQC
jgi:hypothetical protein